MLHMWSQNLGSMKAVSNGRHSIHHKTCLLLPLVVLLSVCCLALLGLLCRPGPATRQQLGFLDRLDFKASIKQR